MQKPKYVCLLSSLLSPLLISLNWAELHVGFAAIDMYHMRKTEKIVDLIIDISESKYRISISASKAGMLQLSGKRSNINDI